LNDFGVHFGVNTGPFFNILWTTFGVVFGATLGLLLKSKRSQKMHPFLERLLVAIWEHFGGLLGCLGALLAGLVFQIYCKNNSKQQFSK
jgi:prolipoprotein diacylglyceryltransferase